MAPIVINSTNAKISIERFFQFNKIRNIDNVIIDRATIFPMTGKYVYGVLKSNITINIRRYSKIDLKCCRIIISNNGPKPFCLARLLVKDAFPYAKRRW